MDACTAAYSATAPDTGPTSTLTASYSQAATESLGRPDNPSICDSPIWGAQAASLFYLGSLPRYFVQFARNARGQFRGKTRINMKKRIDTGPPNQLRGVPQSVHGQCKRILPPSLLSFVGAPWFLSFFVQPRAAS